MKRIKHYLIPLLVLIFAVGLMLTVAPRAFAGMQSESYAITSGVVSSGGSSMTSDSYQIQATIGQPSSLMDPTVPPGSTTYDLYPGFWYTLETGPVCANLTVFAAAFGTLDGDTDYNLSCDLDNDGDVDGTDLSDLTAGL